MNYFSFIYLEEKHWSGVPIWKQETLCANDRLVLCGCMCKRRYLNPRLSHPKSIMPSLQPILQEENDNISSSPIFFPISISILCVIIKTLQGIYQKWIFVQMTQNEHHLLTPKRHGWAWGEPIESHLTQVCLGHNNLVELRGIILNSNK